MCGDFNARSSMWDQQGNNPQGNALEEASGDVMFNPVTTPVPTLLGSQGDTDNTIDLALISPRISPWLSAKALTPHSSDHLPVVFILHKPAKKQYIKPHNPFRYKIKSGSDVVQKLRKRNPRTQHTKGSWKSKHQLLWWDSEPEKAWTEKNVLQ